MTGAPSAHVLIVDDDDSLRDYYCTVLQQRGYRVSGAAEGNTAMALIEHDCPDLVILDHYLPDVTGEVLLAVLRNDARTRSMPVIFMTVDNSRAKFRSTMDQGADDFLAKPVDPGELADAVAAQLRKRKLRPWKSLTGAEAAPVPGMPPGYGVVCALGQGRAGSAYVARNAAWAGDCVVKLIPLAAQPDADLVDRFAREGSLRQRIEHPNLGRTYDSGVRGEHAYIAMEYVAGTRLRQQLDSPWDAAAALRLLLKVARGLGALHAAGTIHGDLDPEHIMLRGGQSDPVLLGFGAMRDLQNEYRRKSGVTASDTPNYMAPEVIEGRPALPASDVYACGVILHELLTGAKPYGKSGTALLQQHLQQPIPQLPSPHAQFQPLLEALMAKAPAHRPADGVELAMALAALL